ncbi:MAG: S-methyl-5-thioribose-1-phosphate isomerase [Candidatus Hodarchaeales archaeon]|jgi:translation initiation factor eIF-2B subunit alpha/methylthioribose-1-phosphate isomerase
MQLIINNQKRNVTAVWREGSVVKCIDQRLLPHKIEIYECPSWRKTASAIQQMVIRGAGTIGGMAAFGMAQAINEYLSEQHVSIEKAYNFLLKTRPTAVDLRRGLDVIKSNYDSNKDLEPEKHYELAEKYTNWIAEQGKLIGEKGASLIKENMQVLTYCNAGAMALVDWGSALSPIRIAKKEGKKFSVLVCETRPRLQGARITAWELIQEEIDHKVITDNSVGLMMMKGKVDLVIVGADRVAANGDIANKIGTYMIAVLAKTHDIPFYVAIPASTFDPSTVNGKEMIIEERENTEVKHVIGQNMDSLIEKVRICPLESEVTNFAFDITPADYITNYVTPIGILNRDELNKLENVDFNS